MHENILHIEHSFHTFNTIFLCVLYALALLYLVAVAQQFYVSRKWSGWRTASFLGGLATLALSVSPLLELNIHASLQAHMLQHLLIGMFAPLALVLGAPITLLLRSIPLVAAKMIVAFSQEKFISWILHPISTLIINVGGMYLFYLTPLYALSMTNNFWHAWMQLHFLVAGYLFCWAIAGPDHVLNKPRISMRLSVLFVAMAAHAILAKLMYIYLFPFSSHHTALEIQAAAKLMYYGGDLAEILLAIALFYSWYTSKRLKIPPAPVAASALY